MQGSDQQPFANPALAFALLDADEIDPGLPDFGRNVSENISQQAACFRYNENMVGAVNFLVQLAPVVVSPREQLIVQSLELVGKPRR